MKLSGGLNCFFLIFLFPFFCFSVDYQISIAVLTQNDHPYLVEWIDYHRLIGVDHFYFYDNNDNNQTKNVLKPYIRSGLVEYIKWPNLWPNKIFNEPEGFQARAYENALKRCLNKTEWIAFIDTDEFIVPTKYNSLKETLAKEYANKNLIYVNWRLFGTSGLHLPPPTLILPYLTKCSNRNHYWNKWGKVIARPKYLKNLEGIHIGKAIDIYYDGSGRPFPYSTWAEIYYNDYPVQDDFLRLNHYIFRDEWFFANIKIPRILSWNPTPNIIEIETQRNKEYNIEECTRILDVIRSY